MLKIRNKKITFPCLNMIWSKEEDLTVECKFTKLPCVVYADTGNFGKFIWTYDLKKCPSFGENKLFEERKKPRKKKNRIKI